MAVLRVHVRGFVLSLSLLMVACSGSSGSGHSRSEPIGVSGSVGDGPVVNAEVRVTDARGRVLEEHVSDATAKYQLDIPPGAELPVLVTAAGGYDLVTGRGLDFTLVGAVLDAGASTVNLSPLSTVAVRAAQCTPGGLTRSSLEAAWERVHDELSMGLDRELVGDPMSEPVTEANVEAVVLSSEAFGEAVRRSLAALQRAGNDVSGDEIVNQVACDLVGQPATFDRVDATPRVMATFKSAELVVRLETMAGRLEVDGQPANERMNDAIRTIMTDFAEPSVARVAVTEAARDQTVNLLSSFQDVTPDASLVELAMALSAASPEAVAGWVDEALEGGWHDNLEAMATNLAYADDAQLAQIEERRAEQQDAEAPTVTLVAQPASVSAGEAVALSWASSAAQSCLASGGWSGELEPQGVTDTGPLTQGAAFQLSCVGPGGIGRQTVTVTVDGGSDGDPEEVAQIPEPAPAPVAPEPAPTPDPVDDEDDGQVAGTPVPPVPAPGTDPETTPAPTVALRAASAVVANGERAELTWSSSNADACTASGGWRGSKSVNGYQVTPEVSAKTTYTLTCTGAGGSAVAMVAVSALGTVSLAWEAPTENTDSTPLTDLTGYRIYYGATSGDYDEIIDLAAAGATNYALALPSGTYFVAMTAYDRLGSESSLSNEVVRIVD